MRVRACRCTKALDFHPPYREYTPNIATEFRIRKPCQPTSPRKDKGQILFRHVDGIIRFRATLVAGFRDAAAAAGLGSRRGETGGQCSFNLSDSTGTELPKGLFKSRH
ncbi:hypothetical protein KM043_012595 [Ampulex compressa]|nr:hypothetical protein KM043_012595 [Ampulex compressa]